MKVDSVLCSVGILLLAEAALAQAGAGAPPPAAPAAASPAAAQPPATAPAPGAPPTASPVAPPPEGAAPPPGSPAPGSSAPGSSAPGSPAPGSSATGEPMPAASAPPPAGQGVGDVQAAFHSEEVKDAFVAGSPVEEAGKTYYFVGARYRGIVVPKFEMNLFGEGGTTVYVHGAGPEFAIRKDDFEYQFGLWWAGYYMDETPFKASSDPVKAWELVKSEINVINMTAEFIWSYPLAPEFAINYGAGVGLGIVIGKLYRTQAYQPGEAQSIDIDKLQKCDNENQPTNVDPGDFCGNDNDHYSGYTEPSWADGGSKPIVFPWLSGNFGFRYKPHQNFVLRADAGIGITGVFFGAGIDYGI